MKVGFIGCGNIAHYHADVLRHLGCDLTAVTATEKSKNVQSFSNKYGILRTYSDYREMIVAEELDAIWIVVDWKVVQDVVLDIIDYGIDLFVEKPLALTSEKLREVIKCQNSVGTKIGVGYNRRFYDFLPRLKNHLEDNEIRLVNVCITESPDWNDIGSAQYLWQRNSTHIIDLLVHLFGEIELIQTVNASSRIDAVVDTFSSLCRSKTGVPIHISSVWDSPTNFEIIVFSGSQKIVFNPLEEVNVFQGFEIIEPTEGSPIRKYLPKLVETYTIKDMRFKPGFLQQAKDFLGMEQLNGEHYETATLSEILASTSLIEDIIGS